MKAWEVRLGRLGLFDVEPPRPRAGEVLVRVCYAGVCGSDIPKLTRPTSFPLPSPWRPGHEIVGTDVSDRPVVVDPLVPCGRCDSCESGDTHCCPELRRLGWDLPGGFAEKVAVPAANLHPLPDGLNPLLGVLVDTAAVAIHGLRCPPVGAPGTLAVIGGGAVGLLTALYGHQRGWDVSIVHRDSRPLDPRVREVMPASFRPAGGLTVRDTFDLVVDAASGEDSSPIELALRIVRDGGTVVVQNAYHPGVRLETPLRDFFRRSIRLIGSFSSCRRHRPTDFAEGIGLIQECHQQALCLVPEARSLFDLNEVFTDQFPWPVRRVLAIPGISIKR